jgi:hypothetical protein
MFYILHHPKGTLMLSASDKEQVVKWSQRQLGTQARLVSVSEKNFSKTDGFVEKSGTGITAKDTEGCQPVMCIMANFIQNVSDTEERHSQNDIYVSGPRLKGMKPAIH